MHKILPIHYAMMYITIFIITKESIMHLVSYVKPLVNRAARNCKRNMRREKRFLRSLRNGTHVNQYMRIFYIKRYRIYRSLSTYRLKQILTVKSASLDSSTSAVWTGALLGAVLGGIASNIGTISNFLASNTMAGDSMSNSIQIVLLLLNIAMPCVSWITAVFMGLSIAYTLRFYILFFVAMIAIPIMNLDPYSFWVSFSLIVLFILNAYNFLITIVEKSKHCRISECDIIRNILEKRKDI